jgi:hypothetical protein
MVFDDRQPRLGAQLRSYGTLVAKWGRWFISRCDFKRLGVAKRSRTTTSALGGRRPLSSPSHQTGETGLRTIAMPLPLMLAQHRFESASKLIVDPTMWSINRKRVASCKQTAGFNHSATSSNAATAASFNQSCAPVLDLESSLRTHALKIVLQHVQGQTGRPGEGRWRHRARDRESAQRRPSS